MQTDVAKCQNCDHLFKISENLNVTNDTFDLDQPPKGAWVKNDENRLEIGATTRSPIAFFLVPFMMVWSGGSIGGIYGTQLAKGEFDLMMSLFGIPFLLGSVFFWSLALMAIWGKVELTLDNHGGRIFTGLGVIGRSKRFTWAEVTTIQEKGANFNYPGSKGAVISLEGKRRISFGSGLNSSRRYYLYRALQSVMANMNVKKSFD